MIEGVITAVCLFVLIGIAFAKMYNVAHKGKGYQPILFIGGFALSIICWILIFMAFASALQGLDTITNGAETYEITTNNAVQLAIYMPLANALVLLNVLLSSIEALLMFAVPTIMPKLGRGRR